MERRTHYLGVEFRAKVPHLRLQGTEKPLKGATRGHKNAASREERLKTHSSIGVETSWKHNLKVAILEFQMRARIPAETELYGDKRKFYKRSKFLHRRIQN